MHSREEIKTAFLFIPSQRGTNSSIRTSSSSSRGVNELQQSYCSQSVSHAAAAAGNLKLKRGKRWRHCQKRSICLAVGRPSLPRGSR